MAKIGLSNTTPLLLLLPLSIPGIGITHPKKNIQRKHLPGELQRGTAAPKVETERGALHTCLWKAGLGLSRCLWKLDLNGMHTHYRQRGAKERRELRACTHACTHACVRVRVCVYDDSLSYDSIREHNLPLWEEVQTGPKSDIPTWFPTWRTGK